MIFRTPKYTGPERRRRPRRRIRPLRVLVLLLWLAAAGYVGAVLWLMTQETRIVFQAVRTLGDGRPPFPYEQIDLPRQDGARQFAWLMRQESGERPWVVYLHGSPSTIASMVNIAHYRLLRDLGLNVIAPEYRGFGGLDGVPTEAGLGADARAAYGYLRQSLGVEPQRVIAYGWSLGGAVAINLASHAELGGAILEGTPASIADLTQRQYPFLPIRLLMSNPFDSISAIGRVAEPLLFLHSPEDDVVPTSEGRRLFDAARSEKVFVEVAGGHVAAIDVDAERIAEAIRRFLSR